MPKLDGLRAIAVLMVLCHHYLDELYAPISFKYGANGVQIFFTISGFLITYILLTQKNKSIDSSKPKMIFTFMFKRALRLFPIYYLFLTALLLFSKFGGLWLGETGTNWYYFVYAQNILFYKFNFQSVLLNHTWSLAVEEQFYLLWPFLIFFIPKKIELHLLIFIFFVGVATKYYFINYYNGVGTIKGITFIHFDTLGIGAILAYFSYYKNQKVICFLEKWSSYIFVFTFSLTIFFSFQKSNVFLLSVCIVFMSASVVFICSSAKHYFMDGLFNMKVLNYLGKISYGLYLYHKPVPFFLNYCINKLHILIENKIYLFCIYTTITILIASISWMTIEKYFLKFKDKLE